MTQEELEARLYVVERLAMCAVGGLLRKRLAERGPKSAIEGLESVQHVIAADLGELSEPARNHAITHAEKLLDELKGSLRHGLLEEAPPQGLPS